MSKFTCPECGREHPELPAYSFEAPILWSAATPEAREADFDLGPDLCRYKDEHYMIRTRLAVPVLGEPYNPLLFGVWVIISKDNFDRYAAAHLGPNASALGGFFGWVANRIPGYPDAVNLKVDVFPQDNAQRPFVRLQDGEDQADHPLVKQQREGVTLTEAMRWLHTHGGF